METVAETPLVSMAVSGLMKTNNMGIFADIYNLS